MSNVPQEFFAKNSMGSSVSATGGWNGSVQSSRRMRSFTQEVIRCGVITHEATKKEVIRAPMKLQQVPYYWITIDHIIGDHALPS